MTTSPSPLRIAIATDHAAVNERLALIEHLGTAGHSVTDLGCEVGKACDYPDQAALVARAVASGAGVPDDRVEEIAELLIKKGEIKIEAARRLLAEAEKA